MSPVVDIDVKYRGQLRCDATHRPSTKRLVTDAPVDNHGRGESFSPTDLVATGLATCMLTVMGIRAQQLKLDLGATRVHVKKHMTPVPPRRIARLEVEISVPEAQGSAIDARQRAELEDKAHTCPVRLSLLDAIEVPVHFDWQAERE